MHTYQTLLAKYKAERATLVRLGKHNTVRFYTTAVHLSPAKTEQSPSVHVQDVERAYLTRLTVLTKRAHTDAHKVLSQVCRSQICPLCYLVHCRTWTNKRQMTSEDIAAVWHDCMIVCGRDAQLPWNMSQFGIWQLHSSPVLSKGSQCVRVCSSSEELK